MKHPNLPTVVFGSPGVGMSIFALLVAIGMAASGSHRVVLYLRRASLMSRNLLRHFFMSMSNNQEEGGAESRKVSIKACRTISKGATLTQVCDAILRECIK